MAAQRDIVATARTAYAEPWRARPRRKNRVAVHRQRKDTRAMNASQTRIQTVPWRIAPIRASFLQQVREQGRDDLGQAVEHHIAQGGEPCRDVLRRARPGEALILASYGPFSQAGPYREYGPVFVLAEASDETPDLAARPWVGDSPYLGASFVLRAYSAAETIVDGQVVPQEQAEALLQAMLTRPDVAFVLARFAGYGCYACRLERAEAAPV